VFGQNLGTVINLTPNQANMLGNFGYFGWPLRRKVKLKAFWVLDKKERFHHWHGLKPIEPLSWWTLGKAEIGPTPVFWIAADKAGG